MASETPVAVLCSVKLARLGFRKLILMSSIVQLGRTHDVVCAEAGSDQVKRHAAERIRPRRKWGGAILVFDQ